MEKKTSGLENITECGVAADSQNIPQDMFFFFLHKIQQGRVPNRSEWLHEVRDACTLQ